MSENNNLNNDNTLLENEYFSSRENQVTYHNNSYNPFEYFVSFKILDNICA